MAKQCLALIGSLSMLVKHLSISFYSSRWHAGALALSLSPLALFKCPSGARTKGTSLLRLHDAVAVASSND